MKLRSPVETPAAAACRVELVLRLADGEPWVLNCSSEMKRFIGRYPRIEGIAPEDTLLAYTPCGVH